MKTIDVRVTYKTESSFIRHKIRLFYTELRRSFQPRISWVLAGCQEPAGSTCDFECPTEIWAELEAAPALSATASGAATRSTGTGTGDWYWCGTVPPKS